VECLRGERGWHHTTRCYTVRLHGFFVSATNGMAALPTRGGQRNGLSRNSRGKASMSKRAVGEFLVWLKYHLLRKLREGQR
jgi:hypothetical protein